MAPNSLTDLSLLINQQISFQESNRELLSKAKALISVALGEDFLNYEKSIIYDYIWTLDDLITQANTQNEQALSIMIQNKNPGNPMESL